MNEADRREQILEAALRVFARDGYHKASIKRIAKEAGIKSSALIYWYFESKEDLLRTVVAEVTPLKNLPVVDPAMVEQLMQMPPREVLSMIAQGVLSIQDNAEMRQVFRVYMSEAVRTPEVADIVADLQHMILGFLITYLEKQIELGRMRPMDTQVAARAFVGMVIVNIFANQIFTKMAAGMPEREIYVNEIVSLFLVGVEQK